MVGPVVLDDREGDGVVTQLLEQHGDWHELERGDRLWRAWRGLGVDERAVCCARTVDPARVKEAPSLLLDDRDRASKLQCNAKLKGHRLADLIAEPEA
eukprot:3821113-Prymnesium_polylepis.1